MYINIIDNSNGRIKMKKHLTVALAELKLAHSECDNEFKKSELNLAMFRIEILLETNFIFNFEK